MNLSYLIIPIVTVLVAAIGGEIISSGMGWYRTIHLWALTPSGSTIGLAWTIIFILTAISAFIIFNPAKKIKESKTYKSSRRLIILFFILNMLTNILWSYLFFGLHLMGLAVIDAIMLEITILALIVIIHRFSFFASFLLAPYAFWVIFATFLTYVTAFLNH